jgi:hypothetical protein
VRVTEKDMCMLQEELEEQRHIKALKAEYELIAKEINQYESQESIS